MAGVVRQAEGKETGDLSFRLLDREVKFASNSTAAHIGSACGAYNGCEQHADIQRINRVLAADMDLAVLMLNHGWCKPGQAEQIIADSATHRRFRRWFKAEKRRLSARSRHDHPPPIRNSGTPPPGIFGPIANSP